MKRLSELVRGIPCTVEGSKDVEIKGLAFHSAQAKPGFLFVAVPGFRVSGSEFIDDAINRGAVAVATDDVRNVRRNWVTVIVTGSPRRFLAQVANRFFDFPARKLELVGVTGTNGKTTTTYLLRSMAGAAGRRAGLVGTIEYSDGQETWPAAQTTPESLDFVRLLERMVANGVEVCAAEVSSHALELDRVFDLDFRAAVFTNLSQDHLDFHRSLRAYRDAKLRLFDGLAPTSTAVVNIDDPVGHDVLGVTRARTVTYGTREDLAEQPDLLGSVRAVRADGLEVAVRAGGAERVVRLKLIGRHNLMNLLAAWGVGLALGWEPAAMVAGAEALECVPGRLEPVPLDRPFRVFVDYAHTPEALERVLESVREFTRGRVIAVFGAGGDRDREKRPLMGRAVAARADVAVVTSDNPRSEPPDSIIAAIVAGMSNGCDKFVEPDRREAIGRALKLARAGDTVVVAGKGHEDYQLVGNERRDFDDRRVVRELLEG